MGKYQILQQRKGDWYVICQGQVVYRGESKSECLAWVEENK